MARASGVPLTSAAVVELRRLLRAALAIDAGAPPAAVRDLGVAEPELLAAARRHRVEIALAPHAAALGCETTEVDALVRASRTQRVAAMRLVAQVHRVHAALEAAHVPALFIKGPVLAAQTTGDPLARGGGDVDVWVAPASVVRAQEALVQLGLQPRPTYPVPTEPAAWRLMISTMYETPLIASTWAVDLHWHLDFNRTGLPSFDEAWQRRAEVDLLGRTVSTLGLTDALDHSCRHAAKDGHAWLRSLLDVHRLDLLTRESRSTRRAATRRTVEVARVLLASPAEPASASGRAVRRAVDHQQRDWPRRYPLGVGELVHLVQRLAGAGSTGDVVRDLALIALPPRALGGVRTRSLPLAVAWALWLRIRRVGRGVTAKR